MTWVAYIVPSDLLLASPPKTSWHAQPIPADPTQSLLVVDWDGNLNREMDFESLPGVLWLGHPWEPVLNTVAALLASFQSDVLTVSAGVTATLPSLDPPPPPPSVATALRNTGWPAARMIR